MATPQSGEGRRPSRPHAYEGRAVKITHCLSGGWCRAWRVERIFLARDTQAMDQLVRPPNR